MRTKRRFGSTRGAAGRGTLDRDERARVLKHSATPSCFGAVRTRREGYRETLALGGHKIRRARLHGKIGDATCSGTTRRHRLHRTKSQDLNIKLPRRHAHVSCH